MASNTIYGNPITTSSSWPSNPIHIKQEIQIPQVSTLRDFLNLGLGDFLNLGLRDFLNLELRDFLDIGLRDFLNLGLRVS